MITVVVLKFEQIGQEDYRNMVHVQDFDKGTTLGEVLGWIKSIDESKNIADAYFTDKNRKQ